MSHGKSGRKFNAPRGLKMTAVAVAPIFRIDQAQYRQIANRTLRLVFCNERNPVKRIAEIAGSTNAAAKNWWDDKCLAGGFHLNRLRAAIPKLDSELRRLEGLDAENSPAFQRELTALVFKYMAQEQDRLTAERDRLRERKDA